MLIFLAVLAACVGWMYYRYESELEQVPMVVEKNGKTETKNVERKKFPINLGLDLKGGVRIVLEAQPPKDGTPLTDDMIQSVIEVMENRLNPQGTREVIIQKQGDKYVIIEVPGERDPDKVERLLQGTAVLEFFDTRGEAWTEGQEIPEGSKVILSGDDLKDASADFDSNGRPCLRFEFKPDAAKTFYKFTLINVNKYLAIGLDGKVISCPTIKSAIFGGKGVIEGDFTTEQVRELALKLKAGRLPVDLIIAEKHSVGPTLGAESIKRSLNAGIAGVIMVLIFILLYYRLPGLLANLALVFYIVVTLGAMSMMNVTLTLPGIAGFILSIGMAVDANVIIFERIKEELAIGKTLKAAIEAGFNRAFTAILDANVTTLIAAVVLYMFGTGGIRGFAVTLSIGILISMYSAIIVTRVFLILAAGVPSLQSLSLYGVKAPRTEA